MDSKDQQPEPQPEVEAAPYDWREHETARADAYDHTYRMTDGGAA